MKQHHPTVKRVRLLLPSLRKADPRYWICARQVAEHHLDAEALSAHNNGATPTGQQPETPGFLDIHGTQVHVSCIVLLECSV